MLIDSTQVMYGAFQYCRHAQIDTKSKQNDSLEPIENSTEIIQLVKDTDDLIVEIPNSHQSLIRYKYDWEDSFISPKPLPPQLSLFSETQQQLFNLVEIGTHELKRLWTSDRTMAVKSLGYALHNLPSLLRNDREFRSVREALSFRVAAAYWDDYSNDLQKAFCCAIEIDLSEAEDLICTEEFAVHLWTSQ